MKHPILFVLSLFTTIAFGQINKGKKLAQKGDYQAAIQAFENDLEKPVNKPIALIELAKIYGNKRFEGQDRTIAYQHITRAAKEYKTLAPKYKQKLQQQSVNLPNIEKLRNDLVFAAYKAVKKNPSIPDADLFLATYKTANNQQIEQVTRLRNELAFGKAIEKGSFAVMEDSYERYYKSCERFDPDLAELAQKKLFEFYIQENGWRLYPVFEKKYPFNIYVQDEKVAYEYIKIVRQKDQAKFWEFIQAYPKSPFVYLAQYEIVASIRYNPSLEQYDKFLRAFPKAEASASLWDEFYQAFLKEKGQMGIFDFARLYPDYPNQEALKQALQQAKNEQDKPLFEQAKQSKNSAFIMQVIEQEPNSPLIAELEEPLAKALEIDPLFKGAKYFLKRFPNSTYYDQVLDVLYDEYVKDGELATINQFMMEYPEYKNLEKQQKDLKLAEQGAALNLNQGNVAAQKAAYEAYIQAAAPKERAFVALQRLLEPMIQQEDWAGALTTLEQWASYFGEEHPKIISLRALLMAPKPEQAKTALPTGINSGAHEYAPLISSNNQQLFFNRLTTNTPITYESNYKNGVWQTPNPLASNDNEQSVSNLLSISWDQNSRFCFEQNKQAGDIVELEWDGTTWNPTNEITRYINTPSWEADAMCSSDGRVLLYVSEGDQVLDLKHEGNVAGFHGSNTGNRDIFILIQDENGNWLPPKNLGAVINTPFAERTPYLHPDMRTLYFSSDGHGGFGRLDVYKTTRLDDTWTNWSKPVNLGKGVNSAQNDWSYTTDVWGKQAYFASSNTNGSEGIYTAPVPRLQQPLPVSCLKVSFKTASDKAVQAVEIRWESLDNPTIKGSAKTFPDSNQLIAAFPKGQHYRYTIQKEGYLPITKELHIPLTSEKSFEEVIQLTPLGN